MISLPELESSAAFIHEFIGPTPQYDWPLLAGRCGCEVWVKHENHTPIGAFKVRGGLVYLDALARQGHTGGVITATRGNHGQSIGYAARRLGIRVVMVVPQGNSVEKNAAMRALGVELVEQGHDFQAAAEYARERAVVEGLHFIRPFHPLLVRGVASYALEFFRGTPALDTVYVPVGMGSGICGVIAARNALRLETRIVGVVAAQAPAYAISFRNRELFSTTTAETMADGLACRVPDPEAFAVILHGVERMVTVTDDDIMRAMRIYFSDTHNVAEGAGAAPLAALLGERSRMRGRRVGIVLSGGNVDRAVYAEVLAPAAG